MLNFLQIIVNQPVFLHYLPFILFCMCMHSSLKLQTRHLVSPNVRGKTVADSKQ